MNQKALLPIILLTVAAFSGCFSGQAATGKDSPAVDPLVAAEKATADLGPIFAIPVNALYHDSGTGASSGAWGGAPTDKNRFYETGIVNFTGSIKGDATFVMKNADPQTGHVYDGTKTWAFTGSIPGCGSGSLGFAGPGFGKMEGEHVRVNVTMRLVPGTQSTGLANVVDALLFADGLDTFPLPIKTTGSVWCRAPATVSREGAKAIPVAAFYDDGGGFVGAGADMAYVAGMVNFTGSMQGNAPFVAKLYAPTADHLLDFTKDPEIFTGSIPGCGSGTMALFGKGFFRMDAPGGLYTNGSLRLVPGSTSTGLAGVVDAHLYVDTHDWPKKVLVTGNIWCKDPVPVGREGEGAGAAHV